MAGLGGVAAVLCSMAGEEALQPRQGELEPAMGGAGAAGAGRGRARRAAAGGRAWRAAAGVEARSSTGVGEKKTTDVARSRSVSGLARSVPSGVGEKKTGCTFGAKGHSSIFPAQLTSVITKFGWNGLQGKTNFNLSL
jgi:hypothetical protein